MFPSIVVARRPSDESVPEMARGFAISWERRCVGDLSTQGAAECFDIERGRLTAETWSIEPKTVTGLLAQIRRIAMPLAEFTA